MADDISPEEQAARLAARIEEIEKAFESMSAETDKLERSSSLSAKAIKEYREEIARLKARQIKDAEAEHRDTRNASEKANALIRQLDSLRSKFKNEEISRAEFDDATDEACRQLTRLQRSLGAAEQAQSKIAIQQIKNIDIVRDSSIAFGKQLASLASTVSSRLTDGIKSSLLSIQSGASGMAVASDLLAVKYDLIGSAAGATASGVTTLGSALSTSTNTFTKSIGFAVQGLGMLGGAVAKTYTEFEKFKIKFLTAEIDKVYKSFQSLSQAGVVFGNGINTLQSNAYQAGMAMETLAAIGSKNAATLSAAGFGSAEGLKRLSKVFNLGGDQFKSSLLSLGIGLEEQGELVSRVMADMRLTGRDMSTVSNDEIVSATESYAKNLKIISAITGDDAKARMQQARDLAASSAMQAELDKMDKTERDNFIAALAEVPQGLKKAVMQQRLLGTVVDRNTNIAFASVNGMRENVLDIAASLGKGPVEVAKLVAKNTEDVKAAQKKGSALAMLDIASIAGASGPAADFNQWMTGLSKESLAGVSSQEAAATAIKNVNDAVTNTGTILQKINDTVIIGEQARAELENTAISHLQTFVNEAVNALKLAKNLLKEGPAAAQSIADKVTDFASSALAVLGAGQSLIGIGGYIKNKKGSTPPHTPLSESPTSNSKIVERETGKVAEQGLASVTEAAKDTAKEAAKDTAKEAAKSTGKVVAAKEVAKDVGEVAGKSGSVLSKIGQTGAVASGKVAGKAIISKLPIIGAVIGIADAINRIKQGDYLGAGLVASAGIASTVPGLGTLASIGLSAGSIANDVGMFDSLKTSNTTSSAIVGQEGYTMDSPRSVLSSPSSYAAASQDNDSPVKDIKEKKSVDEINVDKIVAATLAKDPSAPTADQLKRLIDMIESNNKVAEQVMTLQQELVKLSIDQNRYLDRLVKTAS